LGGDRILSEVKTETKITLKNELYGQYNWFYQTFLPAMQLACDEFFSELFTLKLMSVSKNINLLFEGDEYFVTKIRLDKNHDVFFRSSTDSIKIILDKALGKTRKFKLENITSLETKVISSFNDYLFQSFDKFLAPIGTENKKRKNFDTIHLTLFIKDKESNIGAKLIISIPQVLLVPTTILPKENFDISDFKTSKVPVNIKIGTTKFSLKDLKCLEKEDIVVFENSNIHLMKLIHENYTKEFRVNPNPALITSSENQEETIMTEDHTSQNLWDNIQVEMGAEFEKVKITLGELKNIEQGLVIDISSVYDNRISLRVEDKVIAKGELVIINDRYGVRIDEVFATEKNQAEKITKAPEEHHSQEQSEEHPTDDSDTDSDDDSNEEFDYSDFELDDQDI